MRKFKALGLALIAVLAMTAVASATATASVYESEQENTTIKGEQVGINEFITHVGTVECEVATFAGFQESKTATSLTITPSYTECELAGQSATVAMNGCTYLFTEPTETSADKFHAVVHVVCPAGQAITVATSKCTVTVPTQTPGSPLVDFESKTSATPKPDVLVTSTVTGLTYNTSGPGCATEHRTDGIYNGQVTVRGFVGVNQVGVFVK